MINDPDLWITAPRKTQEQLTKSCQLISHFQDDIIKTDTITIILLFQMFLIIVLLLTKMQVVYVLQGLLFAVLIEQSLETRPL